MLKVIRAQSMRRRSENKNNQNKHSTRRRVGAHEMQKPRIIRGFCYYRYDTTSTIGLLDEIGGDMGTQTPDLCPARAAL